MYKSYKTCLINKKKLLENLMKEKRNIDDVKDVINTCNNRTRLVTTCKFILDNYDFLLKKSHIDNDKKFIENKAIHDYVYNLQDDLTSSMNNAYLYNIYKRYYTYKHPYNFLRFYTSFFHIPPYQINASFSKYIHHVNNK